MSTDWQIVDTTANRTYGQVVITSDQRAAWPHFFTGIRLEKYPRVIDAVANETGAAGEVVGVNFPADLIDLDASAPPIPADAVEVYVSKYEDEVLPRATFYAVLLAFAERLLERPGQPSDWYAAMRTALDKLRTKMAADEAAGPAAAA